MPKLDYGYYLNGSVTWSNVCGMGAWAWNPHIRLYAIRLFTTPTYRVWLHQNANNSGATYCLYSQDHDVYASSIASSLHSGWPYAPGNIQVSDNRAPC